jgi:hypothetical protein
MKINLNLKQRVQGGILLRRLVRFVSIFSTQTQESSWLLYQL